MNDFQITRDKFLDSHEAKRLLKVCEEKCITDYVKGRSIWITRFMLVHLALHSGLRVAELADLQVGDLHLVGKSPYLVVRKGKGGKRRDVYLDKKIVAHLKEYIDLREKTWRQEISPDTYLFAGRTGKYTTTALHISFNKAMEAANMKGRISIHGARHTYATFLLSRTKNLRFVQKQLGHASLNMTGLYADVLPDENSAYANAILD